MVQICNEKYWSNPKMRLAPPQNLSFGKNLLSNEPFKEAWFWQQFFSTVPLPCFHGLCPSYVP